MTRVVIDKHNAIAATWVRDRIYQEINRMATFPKIRNVILRELYKTFGEPGTELKGV